MTTLVLLVSCLVIILVLVVLAIIYILRSPPNNDTDQTNDQDLSEWRPPRDFTGQSFRINIQKNKYRHCKHENLRYSHTPELYREVWKCPDCGHTEFLPVVKKISKEK